MISKQHACSTESFGDDPMASSSKDHGVASRSSPGVWLASTQFPVTKGLAASWHLPYATQIVSILRWFCSFLWRSYSLCEHGFASLLQCYYTKSVATRHPAPKIV